MVVFVEEGGGGLSGAEGLERGGGVCDAFPAAVPPLSANQNQFAAIPIARMVRQDPTDLFSVLASTLQQSDVSLL